MADAAPNEASSSKRTADDVDMSTAPTEPRADEASRKRARLSEDTGKKRGARMFGMMLGTLNKFKDESKAKTEGVKSRQAIDERLHTKLREEKVETERAAEAARVTRESRRGLFRKEDERTLLDAVYGHRFAASLSVANMLCTSHTPVDPTASESGLRAPVCPERPLALAPDEAAAAAARPARPVYFLPAKLLDYQQAQIDKQIDTARRAVAEERKLWDDEREKRTVEITALQQETGVRRRERAGSDGPREARAPLPVRRDSSSRSPRMIRSPSAARTPPPLDGDASMQD